MRVLIALFLGGMVVVLTGLFSATGINWSYAEMTFIGSLIMMSFMSDEQLTR